MGFSTPDHISPDSHLHPILLSFSSSGDDLDEASRPAVPPIYHEHLNISSVRRAHGRLRASIDKGAELQNKIERSRHTTQCMLDRLPELEDFMSSISSKARSAAELNHHIKKARDLLPLMKIFNKVHKYELLLSQGPQGDVGCYIEYIDSLEGYIIQLQKQCPAALERLQGIVQYLGDSKTVDRLHFHKLHETLMALKTLQEAGQADLRADMDLMHEAFEHLETEFRRILTDYGKPISVLDNGAFNVSSRLPAILPAPVVQLLHNIVGKLATRGRLKNCLEIYEDVRGWKVSESFQTLKPAYLQYMKPKALDSLQWATLEDYIAQWNRHVYVMVKMLLKPERVVFDRIFLHVSIIDLNDYNQCFSRLAMKSGFGMLLDFGDAFARSQKEPQKLFKLLDIFETLQNVVPSLSDILDGKRCHAVYDRVRELQKRIVHGACTVFWEFGLQVEVQREGAPPADGGVLKLVSYVINYLKYLTSDLYRDAIAEVLKIEQSWRATAVEDSELPTVILRVMESLNRNVEARSHMIKERALYYIFRMNNFWYIYTRAKNSDLCMLLGDEWLNEQRQRVEHIAVQYQREAWGGVLSHLSMEGIQGSSNSSRSRDLLCSRIRSFQEALADMHLKHMGWHIRSPELRQQLGIVVLDLIVPAYRSYIYSYNHLLHQEDLMGSQLTAEDIEQMLIALFQDKTVLVRVPSAKRSFGHSDGKGLCESS